MIIHEHPPILIDYTQPSQLLTEFLYQVFDIPPTVPVGYDTRVKYYHRAITQFLVLGMNDVSELILDINLHKILGIVSPDHIPLFDANRLQTLNMIIIQIVAYLRHYLLSSPEGVYTLRDCNNSYIVVNYHPYNRDANDLVYS